MIRDLEDEFIGIGSVANFKFKKIASTDKGFLYEVDSGDKDIHYEVFLKKSVPICIDFVKKLFSETDFKYTYPKDNHFGDWAWCILDYNKAVEKLNNL